MKISRLYVETSVLGGCFDPEFRYWSRGLVKDLRRGAFRPVLSDVVTAEVMDGPEQLRVIHDQLVAVGAEIVPVTPEALELRSAYQVRGLLGSRYQHDMLHIALATIAGADIIVSWGLPRVISLDRTLLLNAINLEFGHRAVSITSPREVTCRG